MFPNASRFPLVLLVLAVLASCGGGSDSNGTPPPPPLTPPTITVQPSAQAVWPPAPATFSVNASGNGTLAYQWRKNGVDIPGGTAATYTTGATSVADHGAQFQVTVSNQAGGLISAVALLSINVLPAITTQPVGMSVIEGQGVAFFVAAQGTPPLQYQWQKNGTPIPGANQATLNLGAAVLADHLSTYRVVVSNSLGSVESVSVTLQVRILNTAPVITDQPFSMTAKAGQPASFRVQAVGAPTPTYQWRKNGTAIPAATADTLSLTNVQYGDAGSYDAVVSNSAGSVTSAPATLTVQLEPPRIVEPPPDLLRATGQTATFTAVIAGDQPLSYQWLKNSIAIPGANAASYTTPPLVQGDDGSTFQVRVTNPAGSALSTPARLQVYLARTITGTAGFVFLGPDGESAGPRDLTQSAVSAMVPDNLGGYTVYPGTGASDGTFTIPVVPPGPYLALIVPGDGQPALGLWATIGNLDVRQYRLGRTDGVPAVSDATYLALQVLGSFSGAAYAKELYIASLGLQLQPTGSGPIFRFPWKGIPLVTATKDQSWLTASSTASNSLGALTTIAAAASSSSFTMRDFTETMLTLTPAAAPATETAAFDIDLDSYAALLPLVNPSFSSPTGRGPFQFAISAQPYGGVFGEVSPRAALMSLRTTNTGHLTSAAVAYANPFPGDWTRFVVLRQEFSLDLPIPGQAGSLHITDAIQETWRLSQFPASLRSASLSPATNVKVNSVSAFTPPASVGTTPVFSWEARGSEHPNYYQVSLLALDPVDGHLVAKAEFTTEIPVLIMPAGLLQPGTQYLLRIVSVLSQNYDPAMPLKPVVPSHKTPLYTGIFKP